MAAGYDGSIRIDTSINSKGFNAGIKTIGNSLKGLLSAVGIAFGVAAVINFAKTSVQAASDMSSAYTGLESIMDGQGKSFSQAKAFINEYIADGLVPAGNAVTAYKNLALRGYDTEQIEKTMIALKDASAFGRQGSLTMGEAVQSATEGLKNENSILVDNAGVTKNVSVMWKEYAATIGTTADKLTKQQKIQAEVAGILEESKYQTGDAAKYSQTYAGKMAMLSQSFTNLKVAVGNSIIPIISAILPYINAAVTALTVFFNKVARIMGLLFNTSADTTASAAGMENVASSSNNAADAQDNLANSTKKAGKAAQGALASFDELNVLRQASTTDDTGPAAGSPAPISTPALDTSATDDSLDGLEAKIETFKQNLLKFFAPLKTPFDHLKSSISELGGTIWSGLEWAYFNILVPFGTWLVQQVAPVFIDILANSLTILNNVLIALQPLGLWLWNNLLQPIASWTGGAIVSILTGINNALSAIGTWISNNQSLFQDIVVILGLVAGALIIAAVAANAMAIALGVLATVEGIASVAGMVFGAVMAFITSPITLIILAIAALIAIIYLCIKYWPQISAAAQKAWEWIVSIWNIAWGWFKANVIDPIKNGFGSALDWIKEKWELVFTGVKDFVKNMVNGIIGFINGMISGLVSGINAVIGALNSIHATFPDWVPGLGGKTWGLNIPKVTAVQIPYLATGAVIPPNSEFLAVLGDQKSGTNIEAPADLIRDIVDEVVSNRLSDQQIQINFKGSMSSLVRALKPYIDKENSRVGKSLIASGSAS